jgi:hypothetical protein
MHDGSVNGVISSEFNDRYSIPCRKVLAVCYSSYVLNGPKTHPTSHAMDKNRNFRSKEGFMRLLTTRLYPKVSELAAWIENYKWYSSLPLRAIVSLFCETV